MGRNHIHIAVGRPGVSGVLSGEYSLCTPDYSPKVSDGTVSECNYSPGMRASSEILIHIDMEKAMGGGIKFYRSANNVILTPGDEEGFLLKEYFSVIERRDGTLLDDSWRTA
jgi:2'-phosphotransferase